MIQCEPLAAVVAHTCGDSRVTFVENTPWLNTPQRRAIPAMEIRDILALNLRTLRQARGVSQEELAHRAEVDRTYVSSLERSVYAAGIDVLDRLAKALGVEAADLLKPPSARSETVKKVR